MLRNLYPKAPKWFVYAVDIGASLFAGAVILCVYWLFGPYTPLTVNSATAPPSVQAGTTMIYSVDYCRSFHGQVDVARTIEGVYPSNLVLESAPLSSNVPPHCGITSVPILIPAVTPAGVYDVRVTAAFKVNPLRTVTIDFRTSTFQVTK